MAPAAVAAMFGLWGATLASEANAQILGTASDFGVLAGSTVTNTGPSVISGNSADPGHVGVSPGGAVVGFPPGIVVAPGTIHASDAVAGAAQNALTTAYNTLQGLPSQFNFTGQNLGGRVLTPAVYSFSTSAQLTGVLTLNGRGNSGSQFVFQIGTTLTTASNSAVLLINGANGNNVYWAVGSSATLGTNTVFAGNIVALTSITLNTGASITCGRALARNGAVTLDNNTITLCAAGEGSGSGGGGGGNGGGGGGTDITTNTLFGEGVSGTQQTALGASGFFGSAMMAQARFGREGGGQDFTGIKSGGNSPSARDTDSDGGPMKLGVVAIGPEGTGTEGNQSDTWRLWTTGFGGTASYDGEPAATSEDLSTHTAGIAVGLDYQIDPTALVGIAGGYSHSRFSVDQRMTSGTVEGRHIGLYGVKRLGPVYLSTSADYTRFYNNTERFIDWVVDERADGSFTGDEFGAQLEAGWKISAGGVSLTPFAGFSVSHLTSAGFTEASANTAGGAGILGLSFSDHSVTSQVASLGIQVDTKIALSNGLTLVPFARVAWAHEFNPDRSIESYLTSSPTVAATSEGASAASDVAKVNAGLRLGNANGVELFAAFDGEFSSHSQSFAGNGGVKIAW